MDLTLYRANSDEDEDEAEAHDGLVRYRLDLASGHRIRLTSDVRHTLGYCVGNLLCSGALALVRHFQAQQTVWTGRRVLELGAGIGAVGMALAKWGANVVASDVAAMLPLLKRNIDSNFGSSEHIRATELVWGTTDVTGTPFDVIVGADLLYDPDAFPALTTTLWHGSGPQTVIYLSAFHYPEYTGVPDAIKDCFSVESSEVVSHGGRESDVHKLVRKEGCTGPPPAEPKAESVSQPADDGPAPKRRRIPEEQCQAIRAAVLACCEGDTK